LLKGENRLGGGKIAIVVLTISFERTGRYLGGAGGEKLDVQSPIEESESSDQLKKNEISMDLHSGKRQLICRKWDIEQKLGPLACCAKIKKNELEREGKKRDSLSIDHLNERRLTKGVQKK